MDHMPRGELQPMVARSPNSQRGVVLIVTLVILVIITLSSVAMMTSTRAGVSASANIAFRQAATRTGDVALDDALAQIKTQFSSSSAGLDTNGGANAGVNFTFRYYSTYQTAAAGCTKEATDTMQQAITAGLTHEACWNSTTKQYATPQNASGTLGWSASDGICTQPFTPQTYRFADKNGATVAGTDTAVCATKFAAEPSGYKLFYVVHRMASASGSCSLSSTGCVSASTTSGICPGGFETCPSVYYRITVKIVGPRQNNRYIQSFVY